MPSLDELPLRPLTPDEITQRLQAEPGVPLGQLSSAEIIRAFELMEEEMRRANQSVRTLRGLGFLEGRQWEEACADEDLRYHRYMLAVRQRRIPRSVVEQLGSGHVDSAGEETAAAC
jgi:hypothetical protein